MKSYVSIVKTVLITLIFFTFIFWSSSKVVAGPSKYQECNQGTSCIVGEFLYDDSYVPIATATCNFTSRYPDGTLFVNSGEMDAATDGWYSYTVEATGSAGLYRSQICCTAAGDYLCLDKSFEVATASSTLTKNDVSSAVWNAQRSSYTASGSFGEALQNIVPSGSQIAEAVWGYSGRTLSSFGSLPSDIWSSSSRSLSSFGTLVSDIWSSATRTLTGTSTNTNSTTSIATQADITNVKTEVQETRILLEQIVNKPIIQNSLEDSLEVDLQSKIDQSQTTLTKLFIDTYSLDSKLGLLDIKWKDLDSKTLALKVDELITLNTSIQEGTKKIKEGWNLTLADNVYTQTEALKSRLNIIQNGLTTQGKSRIVYEDIKSLMASLDTFINALGSSSDKVGKDTLFAQMKEIKEQADTFDLSISDVDKLLANWRSYQISDIQKKTNIMADNLAKINKIPRTTAIFASSSHANDSLEKKLKNKALLIKGAIEANKRLLARKSDKPFSSSWLEEGSIIFKMMMTNPSAKISQEVPLKYCLPSEIKKENIIQVDEGIDVKYDVEKKQLCATGQYTLEPLESKIMQIRVEDIWFVPQEQLESLRRQANELAKPLEKTAYFGQGVTIKSNIDVTLDKLLSDLKSAITPETKIRTYYEAEIEIKAVKEQIKQLQALVAQAGSVTSLTGFIGGAQAIAVWGLIIIMSVGFVFLVLYMRTLKGQVVSDEKPDKVKKTKEKTKIAPAQGNMIRFASIFFILGAVSSLGSGFVIYKTASYFTSHSSTKVVAKAEEKIISPIPDEVLGVSEKIPPPVTVTVKELYGDYLKVRETPDGAVIAKAQTGETYVLIKEEGDWIEIKLTDGKKGWISADFVSKSD